MRHLTILAALGLLTACGGGSSTNITVDQIQIPTINKNLEERTFDEFGVAAAGIGLALVGVANEAPVIPNTAVEYHGVMGIGVATDSDPTGWGNMSMVIDFANMAYGAYVYDIVDFEDNALTSLELAVSGRVAQDGSMDGTLSGSGTETIDGMEFDLEFSGTVDPGESAVMGADVDAVLVDGSGTFTSTATIAGATPTQETFYFTGAGLRP